MANARKKIGSAVFVAIAAVFQTSKNNITGIAPAPSRAACLQKATCLRPMIHKTVARVLIAVLAIWGEQEAV
jgi:hypothetical protein